MGALNIIVIAVFAPTIGANTKDHTNKTATHPPQYIHASALTDGVQSRNIADMEEEEIDEMTALSLGIGGTRNHSKSKRGTGSNPKSPVQFSVLLPDQGDDEKSDGHTRKKLRLTDEQITLLEDVYKEHCTLDTTMKQGLAKRLNIKPRQVEVWFQNRRARSNQKQTAADCDYFKRKSERLIKENQKLKMELQELTSNSQRGSTENGLNLVAVCPFCNKIFRDYHGHKKL